MRKVRLTQGAVNAIRLVDEASAQDGVESAQRLVRLEPGTYELDDELVTRLRDNTLPEVIDRCGDWGFEGAPYIRSAKALMTQLTMKVVSREEER